MATEMGEKAKEIATKLENYIKEGDFRKTRTLLEDVGSSGTVQLIQNEFADRDPVVLAVECSEETIALYLVEKCFVFSKIYKYEGKSCDQWCYYEHGGDKCPSEYNALDLAKENDLPRFCALVQDIQDGVRNVGDGLTKLQHGEKKPQTTCKADGGKVAKGTSVEVGGDQSVGTAAKAHLERLGNNYISKNGNTALHESVGLGPTMVHVCAHAGLHINAHNFDGDTALHLAVRHGQVEVARALLMCGADLSIRNKLAQTALDESDGIMRALLDKYKPGLLQATLKGDRAAIQRLVRLWCNAKATIKDGKNALQLAKALSNKNSKHQACYNMLKENLPTQTIIHSVLSEDTARLRKQLSSKKSGNINVRYQDKKGISPLCCAISQRHLEAVQLLADRDNCQTNIRVREQAEAEDTVPLYFKTFEPGSCVEIWKFIKANINPYQDGERDKDGNTSILRAVSNNVSLELIKRICASKGGYNLHQRDKEGRTARDIAVSLERDDIVEFIDDYICHHCKHNLLMFPVNFYGEEKMQIKDRTGRALLDVVVDSKVEEDIKAVKNYKSVEELGVRLFTAAATGDLETVTKLNTAYYTDKNGYNALIRAVVFNQTDIVKSLLTSRPVLRFLGDNCNRNALHYAYTLPDEFSVAMVKLLLERNPDDLEQRVDKDGREPVLYRDLRDTPEVTQMLEDARSLDAYGKAGDPLGPLPATGSVQQEE